MIMQNSGGGGQIRCIMGDVQMAYAFWLLVQMCYKPRSQGCFLPVATERERQVEPWERSWCAITKQQETRGSFGHSRRFALKLCVQEIAQLSYTNALNLSSSGPDLTTLTLVDLPGAHFANDDPRMNQATQTLVLDYIQKNTKSIIVIVSEVGDPTGDSAINLVMQKAADFRSRTICVLTKPDRLRDSDDMGLKVALNKSSFTLEDGRFILLRGTHNIVKRSHNRGRTP